MLFFYFQTFFSCFCIFPWLFSFIFDYFWRIDPYKTIFANYFIEWYFMLYFLSWKLFHYRRIGEISFKIFGMLQILLYFCINFMRYIRIIPRLNNRRTVNYRRHKINHSNIIKHFPPILFRLQYNREKRNFRK